MDAIALAGVVPELVDVEAQVGVDGGITGGRKPSEAGEQASHEFPGGRHTGSYMGEAAKEALMGMACHRGVGHPPVALGDDLIQFGGWNADGHL